MKKVLLFALASLMLSCDKEDDNPIPGDNENKVVLLKVDFLTNKFEGGKELEFSKSPDFTISTTYESPGDFGSVQLYYKEFEKKLFDGTIHWMGLGEMSYPESVSSPNAFQTIDENLPLPDTSEFAKVMYDENAHYPETINYTDIWNSIDNLKVVSNYRNSNPEGKINLFLYTPSVGVGDPADWDWFIILKN
ncbi:hypothetical protein [Flavivirga eckloniae]|nr:hypothetical protein [Flavivirga eckloniae]